MIEKLAVIDVDGVLADNRHRMAVATEHAEQHKAMLLALGTKTDKEVEQATQEKLWSIAWLPSLIATDAPIAGASDALAHLELLGYSVTLLSSRVERTRQATNAWLSLNIPSYQVVWGVSLKPPAVRYTKTPVWKAGMVQFLMTFHDVRECLFVDDEEKNRNEAVESAPELAAKHGLWCCASLEEALAAF